MRRYWVIAPQHASPRERWERAWRYALTNKIISVGWNKIDDSSSLSDKQLNQMIDRAYPNKNSPSKKHIFRSLRNFYRSVKCGDVIIARRGRSEIAAVGTVTREAWFEHNKNAQAVPEDPYSNHLGIGWGNELRGKSIPKKLGINTICEISEDRFRALTHAKAGKLPLAKGNERGTSLPRFDEAERVAVTEAQTVLYRTRHRKMTNALRRLWKHCNLTCGSLPDRLYDLLVENYDGKGRDLLVEAKPDPEMGAIRMALGQLFDYRRFVPRRLQTDLSVVTISRPPKTYIDLLMEMKISAIWFENERCETLQGRGEAWDRLKALKRVLRLERESC
jgi:hypothetical protein